jgi:hypothetical protein
MQHSKSSLIVLAILFSAVSLLAQTDSVSYKKQLQFHLINGYSLSYLNLFCPSSGLRFKIDLGLDGSSGNSDREQNYYNDGSNNSASEVQKYNEERSSSSQNLNLIVNYLWLSNITKEVRLYLGLGPMISLSRYNSESDQDRSATLYYSASKSNSKTISSSFGLGIQGVIGLECVIAEKFLLLAEFNLNGTYTWDHWKNTSEDRSPSISLNRTENIEDGNSWNYGLNNLKIGIAYRF